METETPAQDTENGDSQVEVRLTLWCVVGLTLGLVLEHYLPGARWAHRSAWTIAYLGGGALGVREGLRSLGHGRVDVDLLMVLAALGAASIGAPFEGGMLLFLFSLSNVLQSRAMDRSRKAVRALMRLRPDRVLCLEESGERMRDLESVTPGIRVRIRPGESIALDGEVEKGESAVDESSLTGEAMPVAKSPGSRVYAGTLNRDGSLEVRVRKAAADSTLARIVALVEEAREQKAGTQRFLEKAEQIYALGVILFTAGLIFIPWLGFGADFTPAFYRAMTVMVVASPCALILSIPAVFLSAIGGAARRGVLFKGGVHLEGLADVRIVAFDKTGTLTRGKPEVNDVIPFAEGLSENSLLRSAASLESHSEHPLAEAVVMAAGARKLTLPPAEGFRSFPGRGASARVEDREILLGNPAFLEERGLQLSEDQRTKLEELGSRGCSLILVAEVRESGLQALGVIGAGDSPRPEAAELIQKLRRVGIRRIVMLTGDDPRVAAPLAKTLGVDEVFAGLLPADKVGIIRELSQDAPVAMVGDGVNDAPALAAARVGIAMGAAGTDVALETADVVLMGESLQPLAYAIALAKQSRRVVTQNLVFSLGVIAILLGFALTSGLPLPLGVVGHEGSTVLVCLNGLRLLGFREKSGKRG